MIRSQMYNPRVIGARGILAIAVAGAPLATSACSLGWDSYDPRVNGNGGSESSSTAVNSTGSSGGTRSSSSGATGSGSGTTASSGGATAGSGATSGNGGSCQTSSSAGLVLNPGFENGVVGWSYQTNSAGASYSIDSGAGVAGSNAAKITNGGPSVFGTQLLQTPIDGITKKLGKGDVYLFSSQIRGASGGEAAVLVLQSSGGATQECGRLIQAVSAEFARFGCRFRVLDVWDGQELDLDLKTEGEMQTAFFDDAYLDVALPDGVYNGNFEDDFVGWSYFEDTSQMAPASIGLGPGHDGVRCANGKSLRITHKDQDTNSCGISQAPIAPLAGGASYTLSLWARGETGGEQIILGVRDAAKSWSMITSTGATLTTAWTQVELKLVSISGSLVGVSPLVVVLNKSPGGTLFVDDVSWVQQ